MMKVDMYSRLLARTLQPGQKDLAMASAIDVPPSKMEFSSLLLHIDTQPFSRLKSKSCSSELKIAREWQRHILARSMNHAQFRKERIPVWNLHSKQDNRM